VVRHGRFAVRERSGWEDDVQTLIGALAAVEPARTLDVACGTGFLMRHLPGELTAVDQNPAMVGGGQAATVHAGPRFVCVNS